MNFDDWLQQAWDEHTQDAARVAARLDEGLDRLADAEQFARLAHLAQHLYGEHLGQWSAGAELLSRWGSHRLCAPESAAARSMPVYRASLALCAGDPAPAAALGCGDHIRALALAAGNLAERDTPRAADLLSQALAAAQAPALPARDAAHRALAVTGNNLACTLEDKVSRSDAERELMILAAQTGRAFWALAGTWLEIERAEYRLAMSWLKAGDSALARQHARQCLALVQAQTTPPAPVLEHFFAWEALGAVERAAGNPAAHAEALHQATAAFASLDADDQGWCKSSLDRLREA